MTHILEEVFDMDPDSELHRACTCMGVRDPFMLCAFSDDQLNAFQYKDAANVVQPILRGNAGLLKSFKAYIAHQACLGSQLGDADWLNIMVEEFGNFRTGTAFLLPAMLPPQHIQNAPPPANLARNFCCGIKGDITQFTPLCDDSSWDNWNRTTTAQAR